MKGGKREAPESNITARTLRLTQALASPHARGESRRLTPGPSPAGSEVSAAIEPLALLAPRDLRLPLGRPALRAGHLRLLLLPPLPLDLAEELDLRPEWPGSAEYDIGEEFDLAV